MPLFTLLGCDVALQANEDIKTRQAFDIYVGGTYSILSTCSDDGGQIVLKSNYFRFGQTVCDVGLSRSEAGLNLNLASCRSDAGEVASRTVRIENDGENITNLIGWAKKPIEIYKCENFEGLNPKETL